MVFEPTKRQQHKVGTLGMSWLTFSNTIPTAIFAILASYALWESHAPYKRRQRLRQSVSFIFFVSRSHSNHRDTITSFPAIFALGGSLEIVMKQKSKSG